jgi:hypothetical protein
MLFLIGLACVSLGLFIYGTVVEVDNVPMA